MKKSIGLIILVSAIFWFGFQPQKTNSIETMKPRLKALIIDGENNHGVWPMTTMMMKDYLEQTGMFKVDIARTTYTWQGPHYNKMEGIEDIKELLTLYPIKNGPETISVEEPKPDPNYNPNFDEYDLVISNFGWKASEWPAKTKENFINYMKNGGGLIVVHAADNSWGDWPEFNEMIGLGGWGGRNTESGPYVYYNKNEEVIRDPSEGGCGSHGAQFEFIIETRAPQHPIMKGLPEKWLHAKDELYDRLRGPAENMTILATAFSDPVKNSPPWNKDMPGTDRHEPILMTIEYEKGRVFHTTLGHMDYSMEGVGFITTFQRGAEWCATGKVTQKVPEDFPNKDKATVRKWKK